MTIAAPCRLRDGGESCQCTIDHRKGYINPRLNELRANTDKPLLWIFLASIKLFPHSTQDLLTVGRAHFRTEMHNMNISFRNLRAFRDCLAEAPRLCREVHNAKDITNLLCSMYDLTGDLINGRASILTTVLNLHTSEPLKHLCRITGKIGMVTYLNGKFQLFQWRLCCRA